MHARFGRFRYAYARSRIALFSHDLPYSAAVALESEILSTSLNSVFDRSNKQRVPRVTNHLTHYMTWPRIFVLLRRLGL